MKVKNNTWAKLLNSQFAARGVNQHAEPEGEVEAQGASRAETEAGASTESAVPTKPRVTFDLGAMLNKARESSAPTPPSLPEAPTPVPPPAEPSEPEAIADSNDDSLADAIASQEAMGIAQTDSAFPYDSAVQEPDDSEFAGDAFDILEGVHIVLDESQEAAVYGLAQEQYGCLIGAAGTGKTTTTRFLLHTLMNGSVTAGIEPLRLESVDLRTYHRGADEKDEEAESPRARVPSIAMCAFTGQATQVLKRNMPRAWAGNVMTIHSLLGYAPVDFIREDGSNGMRFEPSYTRENKMPWDVIIVDESSMVNLELWHQMLDASKTTTRFYFIGDLNQLPPPIGMGILGFALAKWPVFELTHVHRQKDEAANRIVDTAWAVLKGQKPVLDDPNTNNNWRVIGMELDNSAPKAHQQIIALAKALSAKRVHSSVDPARPPVYDPWRDRIMTPTNGFNEEDPASLLGQYPLNEALSKVFADPAYPRIVIDAKKVTKRFAVGYRVMATKNESPNIRDRVTNGLTGRIIDIQPNPEWIGDRRLVGNEHDVDQNRRIMLEQALSVNAMREQAEEASHALDNFNLSAIAAHSNKPEERSGGPASHIVSVAFDNGATRHYGLNTEVEQLQIAYASTTHKAQGAEMPTAIIVVHHLQKRMLSRENLYTAITRASQRVIILYTDFGLRLASSNQKISGNTLSEKVRQYQRLMGDVETPGLGGLRMVNVRLTHHDAGFTPADFNSDDIEAIE